MALLVMAAPFASVVALAGPSAGSGTHAEVGHPIAILPQMELLAAVQSQTTWMKTMGPEGPGNEYFRALSSFMKPYKNHKAVRVCQALLDDAFSYDAPVNFVLHLGPLPDLTPWIEYQDYIVGRARGRERLEEFRVSLRGNN